MAACAPGLCSPASAGSAQAEPARCSSRNSEKVTISQIAVEPQKYQGRCVAVDGVMQRAFLFANVDGIYLQPADTSNPTSNGLRLGLDNIARHFSEHYQHVAILGRVQDCETVRNGVEASAAEGELALSSHADARNFMRRGPRYTCVAGSIQNYSLP
jgi:hypothetical protein